MLVRQLSERAGCHVETVRYYEKIGLLATPSRTAAGYRQYAEADVERLDFIMRCRGLGFSVEETRGLLSLTADAHRSCGDVDALVAEHLADIERRQRELQAMADALRGSLETCARTTVGNCSVTESLRTARSLSREKAGSG